MIELRGITARYGPVLANDRLDLTVHRGELLTLLGPSGCGKTTALRTLTGHVRPESGRVVIDGRDVTDLPTHRRELGMVFQNFALFPHMTVRDNVGFPLMIRGVSPTERGTAGHRGAPPRAARGARGEASAPALGRPAAAGRARPRPRLPAEGVASRRAAVEPRRQAPRGDALRDPRGGHPPRRDGGLRDARPGRGAGAVRPHRDHAPRPDRAARDARGHLRAARVAVRRRVRRALELPRRAWSRRSPPTACGSRSAAGT